MYRLEFKTDGAAFQPDAKLEVAEILRSAAVVVQAGQTQGRVRDANGNTIGEWSLVHETIIDIQEA